MEDDPTQKTKVRMKKARREDEELHKKSYRMAVDNEKWSKELNETFFAAKRYLLKTVKDLASEKIASRDEIQWYKWQVVRLFEQRISYVACSLTSEYEAANAHLSPS